MTIQLGRLVERVEARGIELSVTESAERFLADRGYDPIYGARPLKRVLQREVQDRLAMKLLQGDLAPGDRVTVDQGDGEITVSKA